jgi:hypothetical protein
VPRGRTPTAPAAGPAAAVEAVAEVQSTADLERSYSYVRRDLLRIAVLGALMFALIYASTFLLL